VYRALAADQASTRVQSPSRAKVARDRGPVPAETMLGTLICLAGMVGFTLAVTGLAWRMRRWFDGYGYDGFVVDPALPPDRQTLMTWTGETSVHSPGFPPGDNVAFFDCSDLPWNGETTQVRGSSR
jgi:hypothetical protein